MTLGAAIGHGLLGLGSRGSVCISDRGRVVAIEELASSFRTDGHQSRKR